MNNVDAKEVLKMFAELNTKNQKKAHRSALQKAARIIISEAKRNFKTVVKTPNSKRKTGKTLSSGIKYKVNRNATESKIHIMGDFRLKYFEKGTKSRKWKRTNKKKEEVKTGSITGVYFFKRARTSKESEVSNSMNDIISQSIKRVNEKFRSR